MLRHAFPAIPLILRDPQRPRRAAECQPIAATVHVETVPKYEVVSMLPGQTIAKRLTGAAAIASAHHHHLAIHWNTHLVLDRRHKPRRVRFGWMNRNCEA